MLLVYHYNTIYILSKNNNYDANHIPNMPSENDNDHIIYVYLFRDSLSQSLKNLRRKINSKFPFLTQNLFLPTILNFSLSRG